ncbi:MAG: YmfQ family protein [Firmicutes bacterium]|nr:YmfQ family protein [Bacillota bacterium]
MFEDLPSYYRKSAVIQEIVSSIEAEFSRLQNETILTENQFFILLSERDIEKHERDVGINPDTDADIETRRSRVLSKLRGTGTVTKSMMKNVAKSFINGDIEIIEFPSQYLFSVKFTSRTGIPYNLSDIQDMIEEIKPAHLSVEYIFTYRIWQDILSILGDWNGVNAYTWDWLLSFEAQQSIYIDDDNKLYFDPNGRGNAIVVWDNNRAYARRV